MIKVGYFKKLTIEKWTLILFQLQVKDQTSVVFFPEKRKARSIVN